MKFVPLLLLSSLLTACGGSDDKSNNSSIISASNTIKAFDENTSTGQAVELFLYVSQGEISNPQWSQTSGEPVTFLSPKSKGIAFTPAVSGTYSFDVSFTNQEDNLQTLSHNITVSDNISKISARLGHVVAEGNKVSLRTHFDDSLSRESLHWAQMSGPRVTLSNNDSDIKEAIFFNAPTVQKDTLITFEVSATSDDGAYKDTVAVLVENKNAIDENDLFGTRLSDVFAYNTSSPYKNQLVGCVYNNALRKSGDGICTLNELPLIAHDTQTPTVNDIMDRVVVSHQWMGDRFKAFLENYDIHNDFKNMLRATTAIVISYDIRPSFYWAATGAIYLDADNFWLTADERDTLNEAPDYRADFGKELQFAMPWRYVRDNDYLSTYITEGKRTSREPEEGLYRLISLMYHELAHANDFFPKSSWFTLDKNKKIFATIPEPIQSDLLQQSYPLNGTEMKVLAEVRYDGQQATNTQKSYLPEDITQFFSVENAPQFYNYSSTREDYAMLFDGFMMKARYNIDRDVAITNQPEGNDASLEDYTVNWGQRGRIAAETIKPRVEFVVPRILPEYSGFGEVLDNLPNPIMMEKNKSWLDNLEISPSSAPKSLARQQVSSLTRKAAIKRPMTEFTHRFIERPIPEK